MKPHILVFLFALHSGCATRDSLSPPLQGLPSSERVQTVNLAILGPEPHVRTGSLLRKWPISKDLHLVVDDSLKFYSSPSEVECALNILCWSYNSYYSKDLKLLFASFDISDSGLCINICTDARMLEARIDPVGKTWEIIKHEFIGIDELIVE